MPSICSYTNNSSHKKINSIQNNQIDSYKINTSNTKKADFKNNNSKKNDKKRKELIDQYSNTIKNRIKNTLSQTKISTANSEITSNLKHTSTNSYLYNMNYDYKSINNNNNINKNSNKSSSNQDLVNRLKNKSSTLKFSITSKNYYINMKNNKNNNVNSFQLEEETNEKNKKISGNQDITNGINIINKFDTFAHDIKYPPNYKNKFNKTSFNYYFDKGLKNTKSFDIKFHKIEEKNKIKPKKHIIIDTNQSKTKIKQDNLCVEHNEKNNNNIQENVNNIKEEKNMIIANKEKNDNINEIIIKNNEEKNNKNNEKKIEKNVEEKNSMKIIKKQQLNEKDVQGSVAKDKNLNKTEVNEINDSNETNLDNKKKKEKKTSEKEDEKYEKNKEKDEIAEIKEFKENNEKKEKKEKKKRKEKKEKKEKEENNPNEELKTKLDEKEKKEKKENESKEEENKENQDKNKSKNEEKKPKEEIKYNSPLKKSKSKKKKKNSKNQLGSTPIVIQCKPLSPTHYMLSSERKNSEDLIPEYFTISKIDNIQIPKDYLNMIYYNLLIEEKENRKYFQSEYNYMNNQKEINEQMRSILIDWIIDVHGKFGFCDETLYMTVSIIDRYSSIKKITRNEYQCLGITALMIACKHEEINVPKVEDFIYITDNAYNKEEVFNMEIDILDKLNYNLLYPSPIKFYEYLSLHFGFDKKMHFLGKYLMENFMLDLICIKFRPSIISCACTYIVMKFFKLKNYKESYNKKWYMIEGKEGFEVESGCGIKDCATELCNFVDNINNTNYLSCQKKYSADDYCNISKLIVSYPGNNNNKAEGNNN